jgi:hypothetical protein
MKFLLSAVSLLALASVSDALSLYNPAKSAKALSQKSVMQQTMGSMGMMQTRRETIQMPSTSPMVPYMVRIKQANLASSVQYEASETNIYLNVISASLALVSI